MSDGAALSGFAGLVLLPDAATMTAARRLAEAVVPAGAESVLAGSALPHLTLTQCALREASSSRVATLIHRLEARVDELAIPLGPLTVFGGGFLFWCVEPDSPARAALQAYSRLSTTGALPVPAHAHTMRVAHVALVRLGRYGVADSVIALADSRVI